MIKWRRTWGLGGGIWWVTSLGWCIEAPAAGQCTDSLQSQTYTEKDQVQESCLQGLTSADRPCVRARNSVSQTSLTLSQRCIHVTTAGQGAPWELKCQDSCARLCGDGRCGTTNTSVVCHIYHQTKHTTLYNFTTQHSTGKCFPIVLTIVREMQKCFSIVLVIVREMH